MRIFHTFYDEIEREINPLSFIEFYVSTVKSFKEYSFRNVVLLFFSLVYQVKKSEQLKQAPRNTLKVNDYSYCLVGLLKKHCSIT